MPESPQPDPRSGPPPGLREIIERKQEEVRARSARTGIADLKARIELAGKPRNFFAAVTRHASLFETAVIAELKRKSPSAGWIRPEYEGEPFDPAPIARRYQAAGAAAISCLTDEPFFAGRLEYLQGVREATSLPILRKDFIIDPWQVYESRAAGADAILLIAECLNESELVDLMILAHELQLTTLVETHDMESLLRVRPHVGFPARSYMLLGINNRDLATMKVDLNHTLRLVDLVDDRSILVSESGIHTPRDLIRLRHAGVRIVLVGEALMRAKDPGGALAALLAPIDPEEL